MLLLVCGDIESCPGPQVQESLADISQLRGIKFVHQNMRGLLGEKDILETLFTKEKFIITLPETHIASVNSASCVEFHGLSLFIKIELLEKVEELLCIYPTI